jgi:hypothetical protein
MSVRKAEKHNIHSHLAKMILSTSRQLNLVTLLIREGCATANCHVFLMVRYLLDKAIAASVDHPVRYKSAHVQISQPW